MLHWHQNRNVHGIRENNTNLILFIWQTLTFVFYQIDYYKSMHCWVNQYCENGGANNMDDRCCNSISINWSCIITRENPWHVYIYMYLLIHISDWANPVFHLQDLIFPIPRLGYCFIRFLIQFYRKEFQK